MVVKKKGKPDNLRIFVQQGSEYSLAVSDEKISHVYNKPQYNLDLRNEKLYKSSLLA